MNQIKIYHEAPLSIFDKVKEVTDGDYALVHLLDKNEEYAEAFIELAWKRTRPLILDNSAYELGEAFNPDAFAEWIAALQPDIYVVPDSLGIADHTIDAFIDWSRNYKEFFGLKMGVLQGSSEIEAVNCFKQLQSLGADIIGIPFLIGSRFGITDGTRISDHELMTRRISLVSRIYEECDPHPIHLLGVALPQEGHYQAKIPWVISIDTSNPVVHGIFGIGYGFNGLTEKRSELLADLIQEEVSSDQEGIIFENIASFKRLWYREVSNV